MSEAEKAALARSAMAAMEPLVQLLLEIGITSPEAESLLRSLFVHKAREWLAKGAQPSETVRRLFAEKGLVERGPIPETKRKPKRAEGAAS